MLGLLIWATPAVGSELEAQTWIHLAMRPRGRSAVALGKYGVAVLWTASYTIISSILCGVLSGVEDQFELILALVIISVLSAMSYAALYLLLGAVFYSKASIVAVIYSLILEGAISFVPATINQAAVSFRLRTLMFDWTVLESSKEQVARVVPTGTEAPWLTILVLVAYSVT
ncbi:MAG: ABC transporter permease, partial [Planctomycetota bacterium]